MFLDMKMPSPTSTASWSPSPCFTRESNDCATAVLQESISINLTFVLYGRIESAAMERTSVDELVASASQRVGLDDFGADGWRDGLDLLVASVEGAPGASEGGRSYVYGQFVDALCNRLRVVDHANTHPELRAASVERPLGVLGLPRTGTSLVSYLLDQDPQRRSLLTWEAEDSVPPSTPETLYSDPRCLKKKAELDVL